MEQQDLGDEFAEFAEESKDWATWARCQPTEMPPDPPQAKWRIWSNVHQLWYRPQAAGYTPHVEESGRFTPGEALAIYADASRGWNPLRPFVIGVTLVPA